MKRKKVLVVDDNKSTLKVVKAILEQENYSVITVDAPSRALDILREETIPVCVADLKMPEMDGVELYHRLKEISPGIHFIIMTAYGTVESAVNAMKLGVDNYLQKPINFDELKLIIDKIFEKIEMKQELDLLKGRLEGKNIFQNMAGRSKKMRDIFSKISSISKTDATVLITGESGTGKEMAARAIHNLSKRKPEKMIAINLAAIPEGLQESELFGYEKGAFTGAYSSRRGKFAAADNGTVFLDEIGSINYGAQAKLLRVLEDRIIEPLGSDKGRAVNVRIISATNSDLKAAIEQRKFREDLYYRLNVISVNMPPLRERRADIPLLAEYLMQEVSLKNNITEKEISDPAMEKLMSYDWPGNIRELRNVIEEAVIISPDDIIESEHLNFSSFNMYSIAEKHGKSNENLRLPEIEKNSIIEALIKTKGNQTRAAKLLGITRKMIMTKIEKYKISRIVPIRTKSKKKSV